MNKTKKFDRQLLLDCAEEFLSWLALQDPMFEERIQITKDEYKLDALQVLATYAARTLDLGEHMYYCEREFCNPGYAGHLGERQCDICGSSFTGGRGTDLRCGKAECDEKAALAADAKFETKDAV